MKDMGGHEMDGMELGSCDVFRRGEVGCGKGLNIVEEEGMCLTFKRCKLKSYSSWWKKGISKGP
jgi:hypothetical protein